MIGTKILGHLPLDTQLSVMCDCGAIEEYRNKELESITDNVLTVLSVGDSVSIDEILKEKHSL